MIKIIHIADLHLGLEFGRFPTIAKELKEERLSALNTFVKRANKEEIHGIVVAGDLFDKLSVTQSLVKETKKILSAFNGEVFVIAGNHDWYNPSASENKVWNWFMETPNTNVHFLKEWHPYTFSLNNRELVFYPCGCHQKHSAENLIGWVGKAEKKSDVVNIGIAHGNVDGYGLDEEGNYFNMTVQELKDTGLDCWLLGHIHAPYPNTDTAGHEVFFFSGNHCSDSWKTERTGGAWLLEIDEKKIVTASRWNHEGICFRERTYNISDEIGLQVALGALKKMDASKTVLRLHLEGSMSEIEKSDAETQIQDVIKDFLYQEIHQDIMLKISAEDINKLYPKDSIPHSLLLKLSGSESDELALQLAFQTIKSL